MPFSNAYHMTQSSALTLLYAATTFVQHGRGVLVAACACVAAVDAVAAGGVVVPPHADASIAKTAVKTAILSLM